MFTRESSLLFHSSMSGASFFLCVIRSLCLFTTTVLAVTTTARSSTNDGLILHYTFDVDEAGIVSDQSSNGHTGTIFGATWTMEGVFGGSYSFDGNYDYVEVPDTSLLDASTLSAAAWVRLDDPIRNLMVLSKHSLPDNTSWVFNRRPTGEFSFQAGNGTWPSLNIATPAEYSTGWRHIVAINSETQAMIYVDGELEATGAGTVISPNSMSLYVGRNRDSGGSHFVGLIDDIRIYNRELSSQEIESLHVLGSTTTTSSTLTTTSSTSTTSTTSTSIAVRNGLVLYYSFNEDEGGIVEDQSGSGHTGTVFGATAVAEGIIEGAFRFDGINDVITVPDSTLLDTSVISVSVWVKLEHACDSLTVLSKRSLSDNTGWNIERNSVQEFAFQAGNGFWPSLNVTTPDVYLEGWHHLVAINAETQASIYVDGTVQGVSSGTIVSTNSKKVVVGRNTDQNSGYFNGLIDDVRVYNRELLYSEIQILHSIGSSTSTSSTSTTLPKIPSAGFGRESSLDRLTLTNQNVCFNPPYFIEEEHSGCALMPSTGELLAILDSEDIVVYDVNGTFKRHITLSGFDDTEGICLFSAASNQFAIIEESVARISIVTIESSTTNIARTSGRSFETGLRFLPNTHDFGFEGITYDALNDWFYIVKEAEPMAVYRVRDEGTNIVTEELFEAETMLCRWATDLSGIHFDPLTEHLLILSDEAAVVQECDLQGNVVNLFSVDHVQPEGIVLSEGGTDMYIVGEPHEIERFTKVPNSVTVPEDSTRELPVYLDCPSSNEVRVAMHLSSANAEPSVDYSPSTGAVVFAAGSTSETFVVDVFDDLDLERDEEILITLANPTNAVLGRDIAHKLVIADNGYLSWDTIAPTQSVGAPIPVKITAVNTNGAVLTSFTNCVELTVVPSGTSHDIEIGDGASVSTYPIGTEDGDVRQQVIYLNSEISGSFNFVGLSLDVLTPPGSTLNRWTIRMKHTSLSDFSQFGAFEKFGWTIVHQSDAEIDNPGWQYFPFSTPFAYNGTDNLMVDFSFRNSPLANSGECSSTAVGQPRAIDADIDGVPSFGNPLCWNQYTSGSQIIPNVRLRYNYTVPLIPALTPKFVCGTWNGTAAILEAVSNGYLKADTGFGKTGDSDSFRVAFDSSDNSLNVAVSSGDDDGFERSNNGSVWLNDPEVEFGGRRGSRGGVDIFSDAVFRFSGVQIPKDEYVTAAFVQFTAADSPFLLEDPFVIYGELTNDSSILTSSNYNLSSRSLTSASIDWVLPLWTFGERSSAQMTPNLASVIREIVNRPDWKAGNAITIFVKDTDANRLRYVCSFDGDPAQAASLYVAWGDPLLDLTPPTVSSIDHATNSGLTIFWESRAENTYSVYRTTNLLLYWPGDVLTSGFAGDIFGTNIFTDTNVFLPASFYTIEVDAP